MANQETDLLKVEKNQTECSDCSIRRLALFNGVSLEELSWTQSYRSCQYKLKARNKIYTEDKINEHLFTVYHGWVILYKNLKDGKRQIIKVALPGDLIGFQSNLEAAMSYSAITLTDTVLCAFSRSNLVDLFHNNITVSKRLSELNARDMNLCQNRLLAIGQHTAVEGVAHFCAELFYRIISIHNLQNSKEIFFPLTQEEIGDATGLTKIHVNRTLRDLREQGVMEIKSRKMKVNDFNALSELANFDPQSIHTYMLY